MKREAEPTRRNIVVVVVVAMATVAGASQVIIVKMWSLWWRHQRGRKSVTVKYSRPLSQGASWRGLGEMNPLLNFATPCVLHLQPPRESIKPAQSRFLAASSFSQWKCIQTGISYWKIQTQISGPQTHPQWGYSATRPRVFFRPTRTLQHRHHHYQQQYSRIIQLCVT